jgi:hypothetical protein
MAMATETVLQKLSEYRSGTVISNAQIVVGLGEFLIERKYLLNNTNDDGTPILFPSFSSLLLISLYATAWTLLEQIAASAIECGRIDLAQVNCSRLLIRTNENVYSSTSWIDQVCVKRLTDRFPDSPRVAILIGTLLEAQSLNKQARLYYEKLLIEDETDIV